ncbi:MAG: GNAT family N-acetyltransferase [Pseudonocardiaceae bacterium]
MGGLQRALEGAPTYAERVSGHQPRADAAQSLLSALPPGMTYDSKYVYGFMIDGPEMIGCVDIIRGWPEPGTALIGLLLLREKDQGHGLGRSAYELVETKVRRWPEIDMIRIPVVRTNATVLPFWQRMGFTETGEVQPYVHDAVVSESIILTKSLA